MLLAFTFVGPLLSRSFCCSSPPNFNLLNLSLSSLSSLTLICATMSHQHLRGPWRDQTHKCKESMNAAGPKK